MMRTRTYPRHSRWHPDNRPPPFGTSHLAQFENGCHLRQRRNVGYGFTSGIVVGTFDFVSGQVEGVLRAYPSNAYGTIIHWPPADDKPWSWLCKPSQPGFSNRELYAPYEQLADDLWVLWYDHSESCE